MSEEKETICADCGLCCDGTLFQFTNFGFDDDPAEWSKLKIVDREDKRGMELPCAYLDGCKCSIYFEKKPTACTTFKCLLLRKVENGVVPEKDARKLIERTKELKDDFEREFNEHYVYNSEIALRQNVAEFSEMIGGAGEFKTFLEDHEDFAISLRMLRRIINNQFRLKNKNNAERAKKKNQGS